MSAFHIQQDDGSILINGLAGFYDGQIIKNQFKSKKDFVWKESGCVRKHANPLYGIEKLEVIKSRKDEEFISSDHEGFNIRGRHSYTIVKPAQ